MDKAQTIKTEAEELLKKMVNSFEVQVHEEGDIFYVEINTEEEAPTVIGRHGETIRAIQKVLDVVLFKMFGEPVNILVNVNDYREKQRERLEGIAREIADKTKSTNRASHFRGLSSYERKLVHEFVTKEYPDLTTYSVGEGRDRHLVIDLKAHEEAQPESAE